jgi:hypothetical protein
MSDHATEKRPPARCLYPFSVAAPRRGPPDLARESMSDAAKTGMPSQARPITFPRFARYRGDPASASINMLSYACYRLPAAFFCDSSVSFIPATVRPCLRRRQVRC